MPPSFLKQVPLFADLTDADLQELARTAQEVSLAAGETLFEQGEAGDSAYLIRTGEIEIVSQGEGRETLLAVRKSGEVIGEMSLLRESPRSAGARARTDSVLLVLSREVFDRVLAESPTAARTMLHTVMARLSATEGLLRQSERLAQLGTLSAGIAHELNNPASAMQRDAARLRELSDAFPGFLQGLDDVRSAPGSAALIEAFERLAEGEGQAGEKLDALGRGDREAQIETFLESVGVEEPWSYAPLLTEMGFEPGALMEAAPAFDAEAWQALVRWACARFEMRRLLGDMEKGAEQISEIVKALKGYAYLDQGPVQLVDLHEGLDSTLRMMRHKLEPGIRVERGFAADLPRVLGYGAELNQVWTNLIDNAVDAMQGEGTLSVRTRSKGAWVVVEIEDSGSGIPQEIQDRIFDPFFTTKPQGKGTGLGLDISYRIVAEKHRGDIRVTSRPGSTCFEVRLPLDPSQPEADQGRLIEHGSDALKRQILSTAQTIAVVGISDRPGKPAHDVPGYLQEQGYRIIPVHQRAGEVLAVPAYRALADIPDSVGVVLIFQRAEDVPETVAQAIAIGAGAVWMQEGIIHRGAAVEARRAGLDVVMDACMRKEHKRLIAEAEAA